jgi:hypothetical protein
MNRPATNNKGHFWTSQLTFTNLVLIGGAIWSSFKFVSTVQRLEKDVDNQKVQIESLQKEKADKKEMDAEVDNMKERARNQFTRIGELDNRIDKIDQQASFNQGYDKGLHEKKE